jgi:hypothetical protein
MKQVILNIPEGEFEFFMKLVKKFKYKTSETLDYTISEDVQQLVEERRKSAKASDYITRNQSKGKIKKKYGF